MTRALLYGVPASLALWLLLVAGVVALTGCTQLLALNAADQAQRAAESCEAALAACRAQCEATHGK